MPGPWPRIFGSVAALRGRPGGCNPAGSASAPPGRCRPDAGISRTSPELHARRANPQAGMRNGAAGGCPLFEVCSYRADALAVKSPCPARQDSGANHRHRHREVPYASRSSAGRGEARKCCCRWMIISVWTFVIFDTAIDLRTGHGDRFYWTITKTDKARLVCNPAYHLYRDPIYRRLAGRFDLKIYTFSQQDGA
jgi:hypothetical protein